MSDLETRKFSTSKKILWISYIVTIALTILTVIATFRFVDCTNLVIICGASWSETAIHTVVYSAKSKSENKQKIAYGIFSNLAEKYSPEIAVQVFEIVSRD